MTGIHANFLFLEGVPGAGKTTSLAAIVAWVMRLNGKVILCAHSNTGADSPFEQVAHITRTDPELNDLAEACIRMRTNPVEIDDLDKYYRLAAAQLSADASDHHSLAAAIRKYMAGHPEDTLESVMKQYSLPTHLLPALILRVMRCSGSGKNEEMGATSCTFCLALDVNKASATTSVQTHHSAQLISALVPSTYERPSCIFSLPSGVYTTLASPYCHQVSTLLLHLLAATRPSFIMPPKLASSDGEHEPIDGTQLTQPDFAYTLAQGVGKRERAFMWEISSLLESLAQDEAALDTIDSTVPERSEVYTRQLYSSINAIIGGERFNFRETGREPSAEDVEVLDSDDESDATESSMKVHHMVTGKRARAEYIKRSDDDIDAYIKYFLERDSEYPTIGDIPVDCSEDRICMIIMTTEPDIHDAILHGNFLPCYLNDFSFRRIVKETEERCHAVPAQPRLYLNLLAHPKTGESPSPSVLRMLAENGIRYLVDPDYAHLVDKQFNRGTDLAESTRGVRKYVGPSLRTRRRDLSMLCAVQNLVILCEASER
ncbi:hypothetical protein DOTSEDRAFT_38868 [Dothistroma septosporum NZE10]|uniref:DNA2/NAM7 helicase helicase domain-containing protein n=1 Tax=Dothistroma septosporum (strain NZE10 / CBS 128990) TaxID=675120 RepID=M2YI39_DOTSN|nr:hypothetical protein DOTSEDRAFT_38868 [Dothistroma septosporum NZE10]